MQHLLALASMTALSRGTLKFIVLHSHTLTQFRAVSSVQPTKQEKPKQKTQPKSKISITALLALIAVCSELRHPLYCSLETCVSRSFTDQQESS